MFAFCSSLAGRRSNNGENFDRSHGSLLLLGGLRPLMTLKYQTLLFVMVVNRALLTNPLEQLFEDGVAARPSFIPRTTARTSGLYSDLGDTAVQALFGRDKWHCARRNGTFGVQGHFVSRFVPEFGDGIHASWFKGELCIPEGKKCSGSHC